MDLTQESFVAGFSALDRYDGDRPFRTWIAHIALNKCHDWTRRRKVRAFFSRALPLESAPHIASDGPAPDSVASDRREHARVRGAIIPLTHTLRVCLILTGVVVVSKADTPEILCSDERRVGKR